MKQIPKLKPDDKVAIVSPSFAGPGMFPEVYELGLKRLRDIFQLEPVEFPTTKKLGASIAERARDLIDAFENTEIKGVISSIGGDDQVTYIKNLPSKPFIDNPKPFFGFSDNSHFANFLWLHGIPSYYGGSVMTQLAMQAKMDDYTVKYMKKAFFDEGKVKINSSETFCDHDLGWEDLDNLTKTRTHEKNEGWTWNGSQNSKGITWGGCLESIDEMLRHDVQIPILDDFKNVILISETSEEIPSHDYVYRVYRALGERGILGKIKGILVGRPKAWFFENQQPKKDQKKYRKDQQEAIINTVKKYNLKIPIVQNLDFGHTNPQIPVPYGKICEININDKSISLEF